SRTWPPVRAMKFMCSGAITFPIPNASRSPEPPRASSPTRSPPNQLFVNSTLGSTAPLESFAVTVAPDGTNQITVTIDNDGADFYGLAGVAIRPIETIPSAPFIVNTTADTVDANPGDGVAEDAS